MDSISTENVIQLAVLAIQMAAPEWQAAGFDFGLLTTISNLSGTAMLVLAVWAFRTGEIQTRSAIERERVATEAERAREREQSQARYAVMEAQYLARLAERDAAAAARDKQIDMLLKAVQEGTLLVSQAAALVQKQAV